MKILVSIYRTLFWLTTVVNSFILGMVTIIGLIVWATDSGTTFTIGPKGVKTEYEGGDAD